MNIFDNQITRSKIFTRMGNVVCTFIEKEGGWLICLILAFFGIALGIIGFYATHEFSWKWFLFLHLPLYVFCIWALYKGVYKPIKRNPDLFKLD